MDDLKNYILTQVSENKLPALKAACFFESLNQSSSKRTEYAVIGMACRFPGASTLETYWDNFINCCDLIRSFPKNRIRDVVYVNQNTFDQFHDFQCRVGGYLDSIDLFDHSFFKLTPAEARVMDPNQRIFLQVAYEALEHAGLTSETLQGSATGVFVGYSVNEDNYMSILCQDDPNIALGNQPAILAYRLSYLLDMRGPTMIIDTACSSSLVAVHQACQSIASGDCEQAIVGGVNVRLFPAIREISNLGIEAYDGRCRTFDEKANGTNIGDGVAAIIIKRRDLAERDGDYIHAIIKGSAVNSDGNANGITAPNPEAQASLLKTAWERASINPEDITFIETHGTGTKLGDPIEVLGLTAAFSESTNKKHFCPLGAAKTNIGHLEATSGMAGLIKAILCLQHRTLPKNIHYHKPNPHIDFENSAVYPASHIHTWEESTNLIAGVSSFGISGTNCHVVIEEYQNSPSSLSKGPFTFLFSVKQIESLSPLLLKYQDWLHKTPNISLSDLAYSLARTRNHYEHRVAIVASSIEELKQKLSVSPHEEDFSELANLYLQKREIDWDSYFPHTLGRKIPLPTYTFNERRHWPKLEIEEKTSLNERIQNVFYDLSWVEEPLIPLSNPHIEKKCFLFFMQKTPSHEAFASFLEAQGLSLIRIYPHHESSFSNSQCSINPESFSDYEKLADWSFQSLSLPFGGVIHLWDCIPPKSFYLWEEVTQSQVAGAFSLFHCIRSLKNKNIKTPWNLISFTSHAQKITSEDFTFDPMRMPSLGINKVASQEMPLVQSLTIDTDLNPSIFNSLFNEMFPPEKYADAVIGYRNNKRYVQVLSQKNPFKDFDTDKTISIRQNGIYVIAGGAGYLGLTTARLLAGMSTVKIILIGRKPEASLTQRQREKINDIQRLGSEVTYLQGDVTQFNSCKELIDHIENTFGSIHGIFVAIKNISHKLLEEVPFETLRSNISAKVQGTWLLDILTKHLPLDFMATFSSISSLTGGPTGADCSASNLFLDSFGEWRNAQGRNTITMNYTLIDADDGSLLSDRMSMIPPLSKEEFIETLSLCLTKNISFSVIADFSSRVMSHVLPFMKIRFEKTLLTQFTEPHSKEISSPESKEDSIPTLDEIISILEHIWKDVLGFDHIDKQANFFEIGGESISAVKLLHLTKIQLQIQLEISDLYSYPILTDLAKYIESKLNAHKSPKKEESSDLSKILEEFQAGKIDIGMAYEQIR